MTIQELDYYFPFIVCLYGVIMTMVLENKGLMTLAQSRLPQQQFERFRVQRGFGWLCLVVGSLWSLQNLWVG